MFVAVLSLVSSAVKSFGVLLFCVTTAASAARPSATHSTRRAAVRVASCPSSRRRSIGSPGTELSRICFLQRLFALLRPLSGNLTGGEIFVIARIWHGRTLTAKAPAYLSFLRERALPDYKSKNGNCAAFVLARAEGDVTHFITLTHWESLEAIEAFAGADISRAKYYSEDSDFLLEFEPGVQHFELYS
jgi:heme-degrading monooxygenase HmoA